MSRCPHNLRRPPQARPVRRSPAGSLLRELAFVLHATQLVKRAMFEKTLSTEVVA
jgi:hypothetical protein